MTTQEALHRLLLNRLSPTGRDGRLSILIYHRVHQEPDPLFPEDQAKVISEIPRDPHAIETYKKLIGGGALPPR